MNKRVRLIALAVLSLLVGMSTLTQAADAYRAALVVSFGGGVVATRCVSFSEPEITGYELLQRSGLSLLVEDQGMGSLVCSIEGTGCPADDCLCGCRGGGDCVYWSYWLGANGGWTYSAAGSSVRRIADGGIDGWAWGPGSVTEAMPPPALSFDDVCPAGEVTASPTPSVTATVLVIQPPTAASETPSVATPPARPPATATPGGTASATAMSSATPGSSPPATIPTTPDDSAGTPPVLTATPLLPAVPAATPQPGSTVAPVPSSTQPTPVASGGGEGYPGGRGSETSAPPVIIAQVATPAAGLLPTTVPPATTPADVAAVTVIGANTLTDAEPVAAPETTETAPAAPIAWMPYAALVVMLLALGGMVLLARRRGGSQ